MSLIRHLVFHDLRSQRLVLLAFCLFALVDAWLLTLSYSARHLPTALTAIRILLLVLATGVVVQQDSLVGTTAFWRTRPIARTTLLASKALTLFTVLVAFPGLVMWLLFVNLGLYAGDAAVVAGTVMVEYALVVLLTAMAAVVTPSLTYLIVAGVAGGTMVTVFNGVLLPALLTTWPFVGQSLQGYRPVLYLGLLFVLGVPAVAYQYLRMKEWHTAALVALALLTATVVTRFWPAGAIVPFPPVDPRVVNPQAVTVTVVPDSVRRSEANRRVAGVVQQDVSYAAELVVDGQPPGVMVWGDGVESRLLMRDRTVSSHFGTHALLLPPSVTSATYPVHLALNAALWPARLPDPRPMNMLGQRGSTRVAMLPAPVDKMYAGQRALLTADVAMLATRSRVTGSAAAVAGARIRRAGSVLDVLSVSTDGRSIFMRVRITVIEAPIGQRDYRVMRGIAGRYLLRNLKRGQAVGVSELGSRRHSSSVASGLGIGGVRAGIVVMGVEFKTTEGQDPVALDAAWLADAEIVTVDDYALGTFTRPIQMELVLGGK